MQQIKSTFNEKIIAFIAQRRLSHFTVLQLRDAYHQELTNATKAQTYKAVYKSIWQMHNLGIFEKGLTLNQKSAVYWLTENSDEILSKIFQSRKNMQNATKSLGNKHNELSYSASADEFIKQMDAELPSLKTEMLAKKSEAEEYQRLLTKYPTYKDMLIQKFNVANTEAIMLLGRINAMQRVLSEFK